MKQIYSATMLVTNVILMLGFATVSAQKKSGNETIVQISTDYGDIKLRLFDETPLHRDNFIRLASEGSLNGSIFHRVIKDFMIQGGGAPGSAGQRDVGELIPAEIVSKYYHKKGVLAAARMGDDVNPEKKSSGSQFYIVHGKKFTDADLNMMEQRGSKFTEEQRKAYTTVGGAPHLDGGYTVFGEVTEGLDVVDKIASVAVNATVPVQEVKMTLKLIK